MKICPKCKETSIGFNSNNYCEKDGSKLEEMPICSCGEQIRNLNANYCPNCGATIKKDNT